MRRHETHHDDCGCLSARYEARIATLEEERDANLRMYDSARTREDNAYARIATLEAALAAAEAKLADSQQAHGVAVARVEDLQDEARALRAALADERRHADALAALALLLQDCGYEFHSRENGDRVDDMLIAHAARRAAEVKP